MGKLTFIIGGARSGKSSYAERLAERSGQHVLFVATAEPQDEEMRARIEAHRRKRPGNWQTRELAMDVGNELGKDPPDADVVLIDCITLLVSNVVLKASGDLEKPDEAKAAALVKDEINALLQTIAESEARWLVVSNEVGQGLVPPYPVGRLYRDLLGWANQEIAAAADEVTWMVAGIPVPVGQYRD